MATTAREWRRKLRRAGAFGALVSAATVGLWTAARVRLPDDRYPWILDACGAISLLYLVGGWLAYRDCWRHVRELQRIEDEIAAARSQTEGQG